MIAQTPYHVIFFDLDGTLSDPAEGILRSICHALARLEIPVPDEQVLHDWIGPPLRETLAGYLGDMALAEHALKIFRERFSTIGLFENRLYDGVPAMLEDLRAQGCRLFIATGKPQPYATRILEHFGLLPLFEVVGGATLDGSIDTKADVIRLLLPHLSPAERAACVMVGDREHDVYGARAHGLPCIAVSYGYSGADEFAACAPQQVVHSVAELHALLLGEQTRTEAHYAQL
jgi:phosphoglycolate phosphatase